MSGKKEDPDVSHQNTVIYLCICTPKSKPKDIVKDTTNPKWYRYSCPGCKQFLDVQQY